MGYQWFRRPTAPNGSLVLQQTGTLSTALFTNIELRRKTTGTIILNRVVTITSSGTVKHTTGTSGVRVFGAIVSTGSTASVCVFGLVTLEASSVAIAVGDKLRATSEAISTGSILGGTVKKATPSSGVGNRQNVLGIALSSAAAGM